MNNNFNIGIVAHSFRDLSQHTTSEEKSMQKKKNSVVDDVSNLVLDDVFVMFGIEYAHWPILLIVILVHL
jgi:hypothetical protein